MSRSSETTPAPPSPRALAPDLARGLMLLFIALANVPWFLWAVPADLYAADPAANSIPDLVVQFFLVTAVDMRIYPMFAFLFGYGMVQFTRSRAARGLPDRVVRRRLRRRHLVLATLGLLHAALLFAGDVLATYAVAALVLVALFFRRHDRTLLIWTSVFFVLLLVWTVFSISSDWLLGQSAIDPSTLPKDVSATEVSTPAEDDAGLPLGVSETDYLRSMLERLPVWLLTSISNAFALVIPVCIMLGWVAARRRILERPGEHLRLLRVVAVVGLTLGILGGLPAAAEEVGLVTLPLILSWGYIFVQMTTGLTAGVGYVALFALIAHARQGRLGRLGRAVQALGRRSLTGYLAQSIIVAPLLSAWGLGLGQNMGSAAGAIVAVLTWILTVLGAVALERAGRTGPAEALLHRLVDGRVSSRRPPPAPEPDPV